MPVLPRENRRVDLESELLARLTRYARELPPVRLPDDQEIDVAGCFPPLARVSLRPRPVDERAIDARKLLQPVAQDRNGPEGLEDETRELGIEGRLLVRPDEPRPPDALAGQDSRLLEPLHLALNGGRVELELTGQLVQ